MYMLDKAFGQGTQYDLYSVHVMLLASCATLSFGSQSSLCAQSAQFPCMQARRGISRSCPASAGPKWTFS